MDIFIQSLYFNFMTLSARQAVELFHLVFLRALIAKGEDKGRFAVKGGCNLRFFFGSVRYSEDLDVDVLISKEALKNRVDRLLGSPMVVGPLRSQGIEVVEVSTPKKTETTQRWKAGLRVEGVPIELRTKIEFSRRDQLEGAAFEPIDAEIARAYALSPFLAMHFPAARAIAQKVHALAGRAEPQARDVFDLNHLFTMVRVTVVLLPAEKARIPAAIDRAIGFSFDDYSAQVVAYLAPEQRDLFADRAVWNAMQETVISKLEALQ